MNTDREDKIAKALERLTAIGKKKGVLTVEEINRTLAVGCDASKSEIESAYGTKIIRPSQLSSDGNTHKKETGFNSK